MCTYSNNVIENKLRGKASTHEVQEIDKAADKALSIANNNSKQIDKLYNRIEILVQANKELVKLIIDSELGPINRDELQSILNKIY